MLNGIRVCVLCRLIYSVSWVATGQLVFDWDQLENFFVTRDQPVSNKVTNTISHAKVEYHMCKHSAPSPLMHRQKTKCLLRLNHDCHAIIFRASLWSATAIDNGVVETITSETETETWLRFRDETETETLS